MNYKAVLAVLGLLVSTLSWGHHIQISGATIRALPPGVPNTAAYMTITNLSPKAVKLVEASTAINDKTEIHEHIHVDGVMKMQQVASIEVPANGQVKLQPGGYHLMVLGLNQTIKPTKTVAIRLMFSDGSDFTVNATAVKPGAEGGNAHHHH